MPIGKLSSRDLQVFDGEGAVAVGADAFGARTSQERSAPRTGADRHDQFMQASAAAATLVNDNQSEHGYIEVPESQDKKGKGRVVQEKRFFHSGRLLWNRIEMKNAVLQGEHQAAAD